MPLSIKMNSIKYKNPESGEYVAMDVIGQPMTHASQAWAVGTKDGQSATSTGPTVPGTTNNSKYWSEQSKAWSGGGTNESPSATNNSKYWATRAQTAAARFTITVTQDHGLKFNLT